MNIYLDESGDLGWVFDKPYRRGGSSRFLTIAFVICPPSKKHLLKRVVRKIYNKTHSDPTIELKGSSLSQSIKKNIASLLVKLLQENSDIFICSITVQKENVQEHIRQDSNKLYNYMIRLAVLEHIGSYSGVHLIRDNKSIKVKSGNSLVDYLQTALWFEMNVETKVVDIPSDSKQVTNLVLVDWVNNIIWGHYEDGNNEAYNILKTVISEKHLFFH